MGEIPGHNYNILMFFHSSYQFSIYFQSYSDFTNIQTNLQMVTILLLTLQQGKKYNKRSNNLNKKLLNSSWRPTFYYFCATIFIKGNNEKN
jgi:hypothetical protein